jgi:hypothetical protein
MELLAALLTTLLTLLFVWHVGRSALARAREEAGDLVLRVPLPYARALQVVVPLLALGGCFGPLMMMQVSLDLSLEGFMLVNWALVTFNMAIVVLSLNGGFVIEIHRNGLVWSGGIFARVAPWDRVRYCKWTVDGKLLVQLDNRSFTRPVARKQREAATEALGRFAEVRSHDGSVVAARPPSTESGEDAGDGVPPRQPREVYRLQFSLKTLLLFMLVASSAFAWFGIYWRRHQHEAAVLDALADYQPSVTRISGEVWLDFSSSPVKAGDAALAEVARLDRVRSLNLFGCPVTDAGLAHLAHVDRLEYLYLSNTQVTDAGLAHLRGLPQLRTLLLDSTEITDAGLKHLEALPNLEHLSLMGTQVTDDGVRELQRALPEVEISR